MVGKMVGGNSTVESEVAEIFHGNCMIPGAPWERGGLRIRGEVRKLRGERGGD